MATLTRRVASRGVSLIKSHMVSSNKYMCAAARARVLLRSSSRRTGNGPVLARSYHSSYKRANWTYGTDLTEDMTNSGKVTVTGYTQDSIVVNDVVMPGSILLFPTTSVLWKIDRLEDITPESLRLVIHSDPAVELLLIGTGEKTQMLSDQKVITALREAGVQYETMSTFSAIATFNILNTEDRKVAAALITAKPNPRESYKKVFQAS